MIVIGFAFDRAVAGNNKRANLAAVGVVTVAAAIGVGVRVLTGNGLFVLIGLVDGQWIALVVAIIFVVWGWRSALKE